MASNNPGSSNAIAGALTYPVNEENPDLQPLAEQPRQPRTMQGLLRFAMEATQAEDAPANAQVGPIDEERRRFLNDALNAHTVQVGEVIRKSIRTLSDMDKISCIKEEDQLPDEVFLAFQDLREYLDDIDVSNDFDRLGGFIIFPMCYSCESIELNRWANVTLAQVCQNNPQCQERALRCCLLPVLLHRLRENKYEDWGLRALSSIIRNYEPATRTFVAQGGCEVLISILQNPERPELISAAFLITYLCRHSKEARDKFIKGNAIQAIAEIMKGRRTEVSEHLLNILITLLELQGADVLPIFREPSLDLRRILERHLQIPDVKNGRYIEEQECCENIIRTAFMNYDDSSDPPKPPEEVEAADR